MKMTCEQFRAKLDLYIDSELSAEERRAMEEHTMTCDDCAMLLDQAITAATICAEMNEGLVVPAEAKAAWRNAIREEAAAKQRTTRRSRRSTTHKSRFFTRTLSVVAAALIAVVAFGPMLSEMDFNFTRPESRSTGRYVEESYDGALYSAMEDSSELYYAPTNTTGSTFLLQSDGAVSDDRSVSDEKQAGGVIVLRSAIRKAKTKTFDDASLWLDDLLREYNAYFEERRVSGQSDNKSRVLSATIRVPSESLDDFLTALDEVGTITLREEYAEDITASYTDTAARLSVMRSQLEQLEAMNASAQSVSDLVEIHERATELMSDIESYESIIRSWDSRRSYSTVTLTLSETADVIETPETPLGERMSNAFHESIEWLGTFCEEAAVFCAAVAPRLIVIVPALIIIIVLLRLAFRRKKK